MAIEYQKRDSFLHRLDARTKLLLFITTTMLAIVVVDPILIGLLFAALYYAGSRCVDRKVLNPNLRVLVAVFLTFSLFQIIFFKPESSHFLFYLVPFTKWLPLTVENLIRAAAVFFRFFIVVLSVHLLLYTTPPVDLALTVTRHEKRRRVSTAISNTIVLGAILFTAAHLTALDRIRSLPYGLPLQTVITLAACLAAAFLIQWVSGRGLPPEMGMALTLGFGTVGLLSKQTEIISDAQRARGYDVRPPGIIRRIQVIAALLLPVFLATLERSQDISVAILSRGFDYRIDERTYRRQLRFTKNDYLVISLLTFVLLGAMYLNYLHLGNLTEQIALSFFE